MTDRFNTIAGWLLFSGIVALGLTAVSERVFEDLRVWFGDADDVAVDHTPHGHADATADLADLAAEQLPFDLPRCIADDAHRHASPRERGEGRHAVRDRPPPQLRRTRDVEQFGGVPAVIGIDTDRMAEIGAP